METIENDERIDELAEIAQARFGRKTAPLDDEEALQHSTALTRSTNDDNDDVDIELIKEKIKIPSAIPNEEYFDMISKLNSEQQMFFYGMLCRERKRLFGEDVRNMSFLSGGAGSGKSVTLKAVYQALLRLFQSAFRDDLENPHVAVAAYTATAARNVCGTTIHTFLRLKFGTNCNNFNSELSASTLNSHRVKHQNLAVLLIDEASFVDARTLYRMDQRLRCVKQLDVAFGGVSLIFFGELFQLKPPMKDSPIFAQISQESLKHGPFIMSAWMDFEMFSLTQIIRQTDLDWVRLLNRVRCGVQSLIDIDRINKLVRQQVPEGTHITCHLR